MAKLLLALCFVLLGGCFAFRQQPEQNECQFQRLNTLGPDNRVESEGGFIETWNPNNQQFRCAGVALCRCTLQRNALRRPFYTNAPQEIFIQQGSGYFGLIFPGCSGTFEEPQESQQGQGQKQRTKDRHQKVHRFRENDVIAVPTGVAFWIYNDQDTPVVAVSLIDTNSNHNQLDQFPRRFYLAGNQEQEFLQYQQQQDGRQTQPGRQQEGQQGRPKRGQRGQQGQSENEGGNVFAGFTEEFLSQAFQVDGDTVRSLQGENEREERGAIVTVKGGLSILSPPERSQHSRPGREEDEDEDEEDEPRRPRPSPRGGRGRGGEDNGLEETICTASVKKNIGKSTSPDVYNPQAGSIRTLNNLDLPILTWLGLSAEYGSLHKNAMFVPHYNLNANSIIYALNGRAYVQVVDCSGNAVFDGELQEGHVLIVPQNFAVAAKSLSDHFLYVAFKTNARPSIANLAGGNSLIGQMPLEVVAQSFGLRTEQARQIKLNNPFKFLVPPRDESQMRAAA